MYEDGRPFSETSAISKYFFLKFSREATFTYWKVEELVNVSYIAYMQTLVEYYFACQGGNKYATEMKDTLFVSTEKNLSQC